MGLDDKTLRSTLGDTLTHFTEGDRVVPFLKLFTMAAVAE